jgi:hypothetical protein
MDIFRPRLTDTYRCHVGERADAHPIPLMSDWQTRQEVAVDETKQD